MNLTTIQNFIMPLEFFIFIVAITVSVFLAFVVYARNTRSATHKIFFFLSFSTVLWLVAAYVIKLPVFEQAQLLLARLGIFFAAPMSALFFLLAHTMPNERLRLKKGAFYSILSAAALMMAFNISPYAFTGVQVVGGAVHPTAGLGIVPFSIISTLFSILAVYVLIRRINEAKGEEKRQLAIVLVGIVLMLLLVIGTVLTPILLFNSALFLPLVPAYTLIFLGMTAYAIVKHGLFNIKVLVTQALTLAIWIVLFAKIFSAQAIDEKVVDAAVLAFTIIFGVFLIRSVKKEVAQREKIEKLARELEGANEKLKELDQRKSEFLSLASHQLRTPLTAIKGYASMLLEGSFGEIGEKALSPITMIFKSSVRLVKIIEDFLTISRIEQNRLVYDFEETDIKEIVLEIARDLESAAKKKNLAFSFAMKDEGAYTARVDVGKISQVISNVIDNAIKYTQKGSAAIVLSKPDAGMARIMVKDTGIGMDSETINGLFQKFSRAKDAGKVSADGAGLGLYVAKLLITAHHGRIWAESEGVGKGSTFFIELPLRGARG